jgi:hypothetical protein
MPKGRPLTADEQERIISVIERWLAEHQPE